jgi:hypothetical protein
MDELLLVTYVFSKVEICDLMYISYNGAWTHYERINMFEELRL